MDKSSWSVESAIDLSAESHTSLQIVRSLSIAGAFHGSERLKLRRISDESAENNKLDAWLFRLPPERSNLRLLLASSTSLLVRHSKLSRKLFNDRAIVYRFHFTLSSRIALGGEIGQSAVFSLSSLL